MPDTLEIDANCIDDYCQHQEDVVTVKVWPFEQIIQEYYLLDPFLFGNESNLVSTGNPWGKYISSDPDDKEMLASYWYSKTWDENITNPNTQFLLCLKAYVDKTGRSAGLTSYCGEPFLLSALHLKKSVQEHSGAWLVQSYLPNLEAGSSTKKVLSQPQHMWQDQLQLPQSDGSCVAGGTCCSTKGGVPAYVWMGDIVRRRMVIPVIAFIKGDAKSGDTLVSQLGGKNCTFRVQRLCFTGLKHLDDPMHK
jgi:hypothetical protein